MDISSRKHGKVLTASFHGLSTLNIHKITDRFLAGDKPLDKQEMAFTLQPMEGEARCWKPQAAADCAEGQEGCGWKERGGREHDIFCE